MIRRKDLIWTQDNGPDERQKNREEHVNKTLIKKKIHNLKKFEYPYGACVL